MRGLFVGAWPCRDGSGPAGRSQEIPSFARDVPRIRTGEPIFRFNGKNLTGFYSYLHEHKYDDPAKVFTVQNGMIRISGEEFGGLATNDEFHDYHLVVEWKWGEQTFGSRKENARDSGILLHCVGPDGAASGNWMESQECQIIEGGCGDLHHGQRPGKTEASLRDEGGTPTVSPTTRKGASPSPATPVGTTGGGVTQAGKTCLASAGAATSKSRPENGIAWRSSATAIRLSTSSTATSSTSAPSPA